MEHTFNNSLKIPWRIERKLENYWKLQRICSISKLREVLENIELSSLFQECCTDAFATMLICNFSNIRWNLWNSLAYILPRFHEYTSCFKQMVSGCNKLTVWNTCSLRCGFTKTNTIYFAFHSNKVSYRMNNSVNITVSWQYEKYISIVRASYTLIFRIYIYNWANLRKMTSD